MIHGWLISFFWIPVVKNIKQNICLCCCNVNNCEKAGIVVIRTHWLHLIFLILSFETSVISIATLCLKTENSGLITNYTTSLIKNFHKEMYCSKQHVTCMRIRDWSLCSRVLLNTKINFVVTVFQTRNLLSLISLKYKTRA